MAVIFAIIEAPSVIGAIGGGAVVGIATHEDHSDYSEYSDYDDYNDEAERRARRIREQKSSIQSSAEDLRNYKKDSVNPMLTDDTLKRSPAMTVSEEAMDRNAKEMIQNEADGKIKQVTSAERAQISEIDRLLKRIEEIKQE